MSQVTLVSMTTEIYFGEHPELKEATSNYCQWLTLSRFEPLTHSLWMREGTLNKNEAHELRELSVKMLLASRASGILIMDYFFETQISEEQLQDIYYRKQSFDMIDAGI